MDIDSAGRIDTCAGKNLLSSRALVKRFLPAESAQEYGSRMKIGSRYVFNVKL
jgi:hypothetical protein